MTLRDSALKLAAKGFRVFPIVPGGTRPLVKFSTESSNDPEHVAKIWRTPASRKNIGVHTGNGLMVLDIDKGSGGLDSILKLLHEHGPLPDTFAVTTPSGGMHFYFTTTEDVRNSASKIAPGIDIRGHNGFVVGPGSRRDATDKKPAGVYEAVNDLPPAPCPEWLEKSALGSPTTPQADVPDEQPLEHIPTGARNDRLFKEACGLRGKGADHASILAYLQSRNNTANEPLSDDEINLIAKQAARYRPNSPSLHDAVLEQTKAAKSKTRKRQRHPDEPLPDERRTLKMTKLGHYAKRKVFYLWRGMFPLASVSIVAGDPGQAKTSFMLKIAAAITTGGRPLKDGPATPKGSIVFATAEDSIEHTIHPRVIAAGGDTSKFYVVANVDFDLLDDYEAMREALREIGDCRMLIVDPITAYMTKGADGNSNTDVRVTVRTLADLAEEFNLSVIGISHLNKDTRKSVFARLLGSVGWIAAPRAVYLVNENPEQPGQSVVACAKTNFEPPEPIAFRKQIVDVDTDDGPAQQVVTDLEEYTGDLSIDALFAGRDTKVSKIEEARQWLQRRLQNGEAVAATVLQAEVEQTQPFSWRTVGDAKKRLKVYTERQGGTKRGSGAWYWRMDPPEMPQPVSGKILPFKNAD